jgi:hypothetical protein
MRVYQSWADSKDDGPVLWIAAPSLEAAQAYCNSIDWHGSPLSQISIIAEQGMGIDVFVDEAGRVIE